MRHEIELHAHGSTAIRDSFEGSDPIDSLRAALVQSIQKGDVAKESLFGAFAWPLHPDGSRETPFPASFEIRLEGGRVVVAVGPRTIRIIPRVELDATLHGQADPEPVHEMSM